MAATEVDVSDTTSLLIEASRGDTRASEELFRQVYEDLRSRAERLMRGERVNHTLQPTVLVDEAFLRLVGKAPIDWKGRTHFIALATRAMRQILREHARKRRLPKTRFRDDLLQTNHSEIDTLALFEALESLEAINERAFEVVQLRIFGGFKPREIAEHLGVSERTIRDDWKAALAILKRLLEDE